MPNTLDSQGLQVKTLAEVKADILNGTAAYPGYLQIYGQDINVDPNSPDGQQINIVAQAVVDMLELLAQVFASFDPDEAIGTVLDQRCAINGVVRRGATYTQQMVEITVTQAVTLPGLDTNPTQPFVVSDSSGNQFQLVSAYAFGAPGTQSLLFQALALGPVETVIGTITQIVTTTLGVASVNNAAAAATVGQAEETDAALRIRRANSVSLPSRGYLEGLIGALQDTDGVSQAVVIENDTNGTVNTIPGHSIWCIVLGGANADIAQAIYRKRNAGCGMKGGVTVDVDQIDGTTFPVQFDRPTSETLWITFDVVPADAGTVDEDYIRAQLLELLSYDIGQAADTTSIVALIKQIAPNASVSNEGVSNTNGSYVTLKATTNVNYLWATSSPRIIVNGNPGP